MDLQGRNLKIKTRGDDVRLLHTELRKLGYRISTQDYSKHYFGVATQKVVRDFQEKHDLEQNGIVDEHTAKAINKAVDALEAQPSEFIVKGYVKSDDQQPFSGVMVKAFDKDLRHEELLGEAVTDSKGLYKISYTVEKLHRLEKKRAYLIVRTYTEDDVFLGESDIIFNADNTETVDLVVQRPPPVKLSEYEQLMRLLEPALANVTLAELTHEDIDFLLKDLAGERIVNKVRLLLLADSARLARDTRLPTEFFYGFAYLLHLNPPLTLEPFLAVPSSDSRKALINIIKNNIIPAGLRDSVNTILGRLKQLKLERNVLVEHHVSGSLVNEETSKPLANFRVRASHRHGDEEPKDLGVDITDRLGRFSFTIITQPATAAGEPAPVDRLGLAILNKQNEEIHRAEFKIKSDQAELPDMKVPAQVLPKPPVHPIREVAASLRLELPRELTSFLAERKIESIEDIRRAGGLKSLENLPVSGDHPAVKALEGHANLSVLTTGIEDSTLLIEKDFHTLSAIATTPRKNFIDTVSEHMSERKAVEIHATARAQHNLLNSILTGIGTDKANNLVPMMLEVESDELHEYNPVAEQVRELFKGKCDCPDCEAAVSPTAYLADLLDYTLGHVRFESGVEELITLEQLTDMLHQPFSDLPASCDAVTKQVRQVRLCVEVLRNYPGGSLADTDEEAYCFDAYTTLLTKIGTSYEELRLARTSDHKTRLELAERLGIYLSTDRPDQLDALLFEPESVSEESLEKLFGLVDTTRDPLSAGLIRGDSRHQISHWQLNGIEWGRNTDAIGMVYMSMSHPSGSVYRVNLYRDSAREHLVASGQISRAEGTVLLSQRNGSDLSGSIELVYSRESDNIELVVIPEFLSWRLQNLRSLWKAQDGISDPYTEVPVFPYTEADMLPVIDPDLIGPDDFRTPFRAAEGDPEGPFDIWIRRRTWVDDLLNELQTLRQQQEEEGLQEAEVLNGVLELMYGEIEYGTETLSPWPETTPLSDFRILEENLARGEDLEETENQIRQHLKLTIESFRHLRDIQTKAKTQEVIEEEDWNDLFSILVQAMKVSLFSEWRNEERRMHQFSFDPQYFWVSMQEPVEGPWPLLTSEDRPFIDPELVKLSDLPEPMAGQRAITLWNARRRDLDDVYYELKTEHETEGFETMTNSALGTPPADEDWQTYLTGLLDRVRRAEAGGIEEELEAVQTELAALHMDQEKLARLIEIQTNPDSTDADWAEIYTILTACLKEGWEWYENEQADPVLGGQYWLARKANLPKWRASAADRQVWQQALHLRSRTPIIDPDLISEDYLRGMHSEPGYQLWRNRSRWIDEQISGLQRMRIEADTPFAGFDNILIDSLFDTGAITGIEAQYHDIREEAGINELILQAVGMLPDDLDVLLSDLDSSDPQIARKSVQTVTLRLCFSIGDFRRLMHLISVTEPEWNEVYTLLARAALVASVMTLDQEQAQGKNITGRLVQFGLTNAAFSYLVRMRNLLASEASIQDPEWDDACSIFVQVMKSRKSANWQTDERAQNISLSPDHFKIPELPPLQFPPPPPEPLPAWRAEQRDLRYWRDTLEARIEQVETIISALHEAISATEENTLPALRDALVMAADVEGSDLAIKAKRLTDLLLIGTQASGCQQTTRISQAIETVQGFLWSLRTGQLQATYEDLTLTVDNFDEEWTWIGSYATWRAALFVFLYPENILLPSLRKWQTPAFRKMVADLRTSRALTTKDACIAANEYADYFEDVCTLSVEATCYGKTRIHKDNSCGMQWTPESRDLFYMFATGEKTGKVYWSALDPEDEVGYPQTFWETVPGLEDVKLIKIVGSVPYKKANEQRFIFLFLLVEEGGETKLLFTKYDLEKGGWDSESSPLVLPSFTLYDEVFTVQSTFDDEPPRLVMHKTKRTQVVESYVGRLYLRSLNEDGTDWQEAVVQEDETGTEDEWSNFTLYAYIHGRPVLHSAILYDQHDQRWISLCFKSNGLEITSERFLYVSKIEINKNPPYDVLMEVDMNRKSWRILQSTFFGALQLTATSRGTWMIYAKDAEGELWHVNTDDNIEYGPGDFIHTVDVMNNCKQIISHFGQVRMTGAMNAVFRVIDWFTERKPEFRLMTYEGDEGGNYVEISRQQINPKCPPHVLVRGDLTNLFNISERFSDTELQVRRYLIRQIFRDNPDSPTSFKAYLEEAYYFVPVHLAMQLQRQGNYTTALDWFRTVYDYRAPIDRRKISYVLEREEDLSLIYVRDDDWLLDPLNPHQIASTRQKTYTRFTLLALVRCFLEYADAEFSLDTAESVPKARTLYTTALELLGEPTFTRTCEDLIGELNIEVGESVATEYKGRWNALILDLIKINNTKIVAVTIEEVKGIMAGNESWEIRMAQALECVRSVPPPAPRLMSTVCTGQKGNLKRGQELLLSSHMIAEAAVKIGNSMKDRMIPFALPIEAPERVEREAVGIEATVNAAGFYGYQPALSFDFCIPPNPLLNALRLQVELNLYKIRTCRNIAGMERQLDPYSAPTDTVSGLPQIGAGGQLVLPGTVTLQPTPYRYQVLIERAKQLVQMAAQFEVSMLSALEKRDAESYLVLKANQDMQLTRQGVRLQVMRVKEAEDGVDLAELQRDRAQVLADTYQEWILAGLNEFEKYMIDAYELARDFRITAVALSGAARAAQILVSLNQPFNLKYFIALAGAAAAVAEATTTGLAIGYETEARIAAINASHERRKDEWELQKKVADQDISIGNQQIKLAKDHVRIVGQERKIAEMQADHAQETADFLATKFTNVELYDWMSGVLEGVYSFFLQQATSMAKLAENQIAFERQEVPPAYIQADYWEAPADMALSSAEGTGPDRRGLTGSARLLEDIYQLDLYSFKTDHRKLQLTKTFSLAHMAPAEFERFRQTGVMTFTTPMEIFDHDFPGHYLRLIKRVSSSVLALIPPIAGIHATFSTTGLSRVVIGSGGLFQQINARRLPESIALTSPVNATGLFELTPQTQEMMLPFEGMGVDTSWEFRMPKASNQFDYNTIADVLLTIEYTALDDFAYRQQVIRELDNSVSGDLPFSFHNQLPDQWYELHNPEQTDTPMVVRFETRRGDFPPNIEDLRIQHIILYFARSDGATFEVPVSHLHFTERESTGPIGGGATSNEGVISTRSGSAGSWMAMIGKAPAGIWELALPNTAEIRNRFKNGEIENILFVITYKGRTPDWP
jgi:peptidoglycan hydrolase-like protein with peptidoglycan-binding domain